MPCERLGFLDFGPALQHKVDIRNSTSVKVNLATRCVLGDAGCLQVFVQ